MLNAIGDSLSDLASSNDGEDGEDEDDDDEDPAGGKLSVDDEPSWVMGTISKTLQYRMEHFRPKQMQLDKFMQPDWREAAEIFRVRDMKYGTTELTDTAVVQPQKAEHAASSLPMTFGEPIVTLDSVPRQLQMPQVTSQPGSSHMRRGSQLPQTHECIQSLSPSPMPNWSPLPLSQHDESVCFNPCIARPKLITISRADSDEVMATAPASQE